MKSMDLMLEYHLMRRYTRLSCKRNKWLQMELIQKHPTKKMEQLNKEWKHLTKKWLKVAQKKEMITARITNWIQAQKTLMEMYGATPKQMKKYRRIMKLRTAYLTKMAKHLI